ncbi:MAG: Hsp20/alpha crystallin family protein [Bacteroidales bacterium]
MKFIAHDPVMRMLMNNFRNQEQETERRCNWRPAANVTENDDAFQIELAVPGFSKADFRISIEKNIMTISTELEKENEKPDQHYRIREFSRADFCRSFSMPETVNQDGIKASYKNGILTLALPKKEEVRIRKQIQVA